MMLSMIFYLNKDLFQQQKYINDLYCCHVSGGYLVWSAMVAGTS